MAFTKVARTTSTATKAARPIPAGATYGVARFGVAHYGAGSAFSSKTTRPASSATKAARPNP